MRRSSDARSSPLPAMKHEGGSAGVEGGVGGGQRRGTSCTQAVCSAAHPGLALHAGALGCGAGRLALYACPHHCCGCPPTVAPESRHSACWHQRHMCTPRLAVRPPYRPLQRQGPRRTLLRRCRRPPQPPPCSAGPATTAGPPLQAMPAASQTIGRQLTAHTRACNVIATAPSSASLGTLAPARVAPHLPDVALRPRDRCRRSAPCHLLRRAACSTTPFRRRRGRSWLQSAVCEASRANGCT